jgi:hypothetical protein
MIIFTGCTEQEYPGRQSTGASWKKNLYKKDFERCLEHRDNG